jgi:hypothetical protein
VGGWERFVLTGCVHHVAVIPLGSVALWPSGSSCEFPLVWFAVGYRVLSVHAGSPGANTTIVHNGTRPLMKEERINNHPLVPYFDFIISINGKLLVRLEIEPPSGPF